MKVNAILLAAGMSERMKGPNKLIVPHKGQTVITRSYAAISQSNVGSVVVVTGRDRSEIQRALMLPDSDIFVHNRLFANGMTSSIQTGLTQLLDSDAVMICLGDMPWLNSDDYNELITVFKREGGKDKILVPWYDGQRANPVIFGSAYFDDMLNHQEPDGCNGIVRANTENVLNLKVESERFIRDIDTPEDLRRLKTHAY